MTFDPFGDFESRGYLRNTKGLKDPEAVRLFEHIAFRLNVADALAALQAACPLRYRDVLDTHKRLFSEVYPWAGQDREATASRIAVGRAGRYDLFAHPQDARRAVEHALDMAADPVRMGAKPGEVMGLLCHGHPFLEGNGRTLMTVHAELCRRAGFRVAWEGVAKPDYLAALTRELEQPGKALDTLLAPHLQRPAASVAQEAERLRLLPGLGPPAGPSAPPGAKPPATGVIPDAMRAPEPATPPPVQASLIDRLQAFEDRMDAERKRAPKADDTPGPQPDGTPRPTQGPKP